MRLALKFVKGKWKTYADKDAPEVVGNTESFAVDVLSYANGWVKWENKRPVHKYVFRPIDGWILPTKDKLGGEPSDSADMRRRRSPDD